MNDRQVKCLGASLAAVGLALTLFASLAGADSRGGLPVPFKSAGNAEATVPAPAGAPAQPSP